MPRRRLVCIGDSWCAGDASPDNPNRLIDLWEAKYPDAPTSLDYGRNSTTYPSWIAAITAEQTHPAQPNYGPLNTVLQQGDLIFFELGANDALFSFVFPTDPQYAATQQRASRSELMNFFMTIPDALVIVPDYWGPITGSLIPYTDEVQAPIPNLVADSPMSSRPTYPRNVVSGERPFQREQFRNLYGDRIEYITQVSNSAPNQSIGGDGLHQPSAGYESRAAYYNDNSIFINHRSEY